MTLLLPHSRPPANGSARVLAYLRVSSDGQVEDGYSLETQAQLVRDWCLRTFGENGYRLTILRDEGLSGSLGWQPAKEGSRKFRPGLAEAVSLLEKKQVDHFVVYRTDRAFRNHLEFAQFIHRFFGEGSCCTFHSLTEALDLRTLTGQLSANVLSVIAEYQRGVIRDNVKDGLASRRRAGYPTGDIGYGWRRTPRLNGSRPGLEPDPERADFVVRAYALFRSGWGTRRIARELERLGAPLPGKSGRWSASSIKALLHNPLHAGYIRDAGKLVPGVHCEQRLVEPEDFDWVQREMKQRHREPTQTISKETQPLYRVARCGTCDSLLTVVDETTGLAYRCRGSADRGDVLPPPDSATDESEEGPDEQSRLLPDASEPGPTTSPRWCSGWHKSADLINRQLLATLTDAIRSPEFQRLAEAEARALLLQDGRLALQKQLREKARALTKHQERKERLARGYMNGSIEEEDYQKLFQEVKSDLEAVAAEVAELERRLAHQEDEEALLGRVRERLPQVEEVWETLQPGERRQLVRDLTEYVVVERLRAGRVQLRIKIPFLNETHAEIGHGKSRAMGFARGVAGLSPRELALLCLLAEGHSMAQIRERWNVQTGQLSNVKQSILRRLEVNTLAEAVELAQERLTSERAALPLDVPPAAPRASWRPTQEQRLAQILQGYEEGLTREQVAEKLELAPQTVRVLEYKARECYQAATLAEAVARYRENPGRLATTPPPARAVPPMSETRSVQVLERYARGLTRPEIAADLGLQPETVRAVETRAKKRYGCKKLSEAVAAFLAQQPEEDGQS